MTQMSTARAGVLEALADAPGSVTVLQLAETLGQHANTVREHLEAIVDAGLATRSRSTTNRRGRPAILYRAIPPEAARPQVREYASLAMALAAQLAKISPSPVDDAIEAGKLWGEDLGRSGPSGVAGARARTLDVLSTLGFDPQPQEDGSVDLHECPLLEAAKQQPGIVCAVHLGLVRALHEGQDAPSADVTLEPFAKPGACILRLPVEGRIGSTIPDNSALYKRFAEAAEAPADDEPTSSCGCCDDAAGDEGDRREEAAGTALIEVTETVRAASAQAPGSRDAPIS